MEKQAYENGKDAERRFLNLDLQEGKDPQSLSREAFEEITSEILNAQEMLKENPESEFWKKQLAYNQGRLSVLD